MCFHFSTAKEAQYLELRYNAKFSEDSDTIRVKSSLPIWHLNGFGHPSVPIISNNHLNEITTAKWGLIPSWIRNEQEAINIRKFNLNARCESIFEKSSFRHSIMRRRCLIPADGFYEWCEFKEKKYPFFIFLKNQDVFSFGGIYDEWIHNENNEKYRTFSIITTPANSLLEKIHNTKKRMPLIFTKENEKLWLTENNLKEIKALMLPISDSFLSAYTISRLISSKNIQSNIPEIQKPFDYSELTEIG